MADWHAAAALRRAFVHSVGGMAHAGAPLKGWGATHRGGGPGRPAYSGYKFIKVEKAARVATVTLNRPDRLNAVNPALHHELMTIWNDLAEDREVNAIILTGAGRAFCAGGDVKGMASGTLASPSGGTSERITAAEGRRIVQNMLDVEQPIIGAINGAAVGLGATIALLCDIIVASQKARFADTHVKVGVVAGDRGARVLPRPSGPAGAQDFLFSRGAINAAAEFKIAHGDHRVEPSA